MPSLVQWMEKMKNKTFSTDSVCVGKVIVLSGVLFCYYTTLPCPPAQCLLVGKRFKKYKNLKNVVGGYCFFVCFKLHFFYRLKRQCDFCSFSIRKYKKMWVCLLRWEMRDVRFKFQKTLLKWNWIWGRMSASGLRLWRICCWNHWIEN